MSRYTKMFLSYLVGVTFLPSYLMQVVEPLASSIPPASLILFVNLTVQVLLLLVGIWFLKEDLLTDLKAIRVNFKFIRRLFIGFGCLFSLNIGTSLILAMVSNASDSSVNQQAIESVMVEFPLLMSVMSIFLAPITEELVFRLTLIKLLKKPWLGLVFSSLFFGLVHVAAGDWIHMISYTVSGFVLGVAYLKYDNICYPIGIHLLNNLVATLIYF